MIIICDIYLLILVAKEVITLDEDWEQDTQVSSEPYYLQLWEIERKRKDGNCSYEHAEKAYKDLQKLHKSNLRIMEKITWLHM